MRQSIKKIKKEVPPLKVLPSDVAILITIFAHEFAKMVIEQHLVKSK